MKKTVLTLALIVAVGISGISLAEARRGGWGPGNGPGAGPGGCNGPCREQVQQDPAAAAAQEKFFADSAQLRQELQAKRQEYFAILNQETPDKEQAAQAWSEMFDLQNQLHAMASAAGIERGWGQGGRFGGGGCSGQGGPCGGPGQGPNGACWKNAQIGADQQP